MRLFILLFTLLLSANTVTAQKKTLQEKALQEIDSLVPASAYSRRRFVRTSLGSGFAAAVLPVTAQTIKTDTGGVTAGEVTIPVGDFKLPVFRAQWLAILAARQAHR